MLGYIHLLEFANLSIVNFLKAAYISSGIAKGSRLFLTTPSDGHPFQYIISLFFLLLLFTPTSRLPLSIFLTAYGLPLLVMSLSIKNDEKLARAVFSSDSLTMNLRNSVVASISESEEETFLWGFY